MSGPGCALACWETEGQSDPSYPAYPIKDCDHDPGKHLVELKTVELMSAAAPVGWQGSTGQAIQTWVLVPRLH